MTFGFVGATAIVVMVPNVEPPASPLVRSGLIAFHQSPPSVVFQTL